MLRKREGRQETNTAQNANRPCAPLLPTPSLSGVSPVLSTTVASTTHTPRESCSSLTPLATLQRLKCTSTQMIAKAVEAAAPSRERDAWYERKAHWEGTARRRQEARAAAAAAPFHSVVHADGAAAGVGRSGAARWHGAMGARGGGAAAGGGRNHGGAEGDGGGDEGDGDGGYRLNKIQTVLAVAVMLVMAVFKLRSVR